MTNEIQSGPIVVHLPQPQAGFEYLFSCTAAGVIHVTTKPTPAQLRYIVPPGFEYRPVYANMPTCATLELWPLAPTPEMTFGERWRLRRRQLKSLRQLRRAARRQRWQARRERWLKLWRRLVALPSELFTGI